MLFNTLAKQNAKVANFPGVSVEIRKAEFTLSLTGRCQLVDLPGSYSLYPRSEDELVAASSLLRSCPKGSRDIILAVLDATNLERNLYLLTQLLELGKPIVAALTMMDVADRVGVSIDWKKLETITGIAMVPVSSVTGAGIERLKATLDSFIAYPRPPAPIQSVDIDMSPENRTDLTKIGGTYSQQFGFSPNLYANYGLLAYFDRSKVSGQAMEAEHLQWPLHMIGEIAKTIERRYALVEGWMRAVTIQGPSNVNQQADSSALSAGNGRIGGWRSKDLTAILDSFFLHKVFGPLALLVIFASMFAVLFSWLDPIVGVIENISGKCGEFIQALFPENSLVASLLSDGIIAGIGSVLAFVPLIATLFFFLGILEDSGYLARATYLLDRVMRKVGLSGKAFVPLLSGFACAVPAIMSTRVIESKSNRLITILVTPLMSCSARLPIYGLLIASLFSAAPPVFGFINAGAVVMTLMYSLGMVCAFCMAWLIRKFVFKSAISLLILELPSYRRPRFSSLFKSVLARVQIFLKEVGTVILAMTIVMWALFTFPRANISEQESGSSQNSHIAESYAGQLGHAMEPLIAPLGFNWKIGVGILASFAAREVFVSTMGIIYGIGDGSDNDSNSLRAAIRSDVNPITNKPVFSPLVGLSLMVFFALAMQCMSTLVATRRETGTWGWPVVQLVYMTVLAWGASFLVFQGGTLLGFG